MYITLRSAPGCIDENGESNVLKVVNITDIRRPKLVQNYPMKSQLDSPYQMMCCLFVIMIV